MSQPGQKFRHFDSETLPHTNHGCDVYAPAVMFLSEILGSNIHREILREGDLVKPSQGRLPES
jgi:hypothetical protein